MRHLFLAYNHANFVGRRVFMTNAHETALKDIRLDRHRLFFITHRNEHIPMREGDQLLGRDCNVEVRNGVFQKLWGEVHSQFIENAFMTWLKNNAGWRRPEVALAFPDRATCKKDYGYIGTTATNKQIASGNMLFMDPGEETVFSLKSGTVVFTVDEGCWEVSSPTTAREEFKNRELPRMVQQLRPKDDMLDNRRWTF